MLLNDFIFYCFPLITFHPLHSAVDSEEVHIEMFFSISLSFPLQNGLTSSITSQSSDGINDGTM